MMILQKCVESYPRRPVLDPAEWPYTRAELEARVDFWMRKLDGLRG